MGESYTDKVNSKDIPIINNIISLELYFNKLHFEKELLEKGFKCINTKFKQDTYYEIEIDGLHLLYFNRFQQGKLTINIKEDRMIKYKDSKEFKLSNGIAISKQLNFNKCNGLELYGLGDIRNKLIKLDSKWCEPSWLPNTLLYEDEDSGLSYFQYDGYYKMCRDSIEEIDLTKILF